MIRKLCLMQFVITIQKLILNTAIGNNNFLELNQTTYNLTIWIQLFPSLIHDLKYNQIFPLLDINDDNQSHFTLSMLMQSNDFRFIVNTYNTEANFGIDIVNQNYQWIGFVLQSDNCIINYHIWHPYNKNNIQDQSDCQKARIITTFTEIITLLVYDEYQQNITNHYFMIDQYPFFYKHKFQIQNDYNLINIIAYARIILKYDDNSFYIAVFLFKTQSILLFYEDSKFYLWNVTDSTVETLFNYTYEIKKQVWLLYKISFQQNQMHIQLEQGEFYSNKIVDIQEKYANQIIYQLYNQRAIHQKVLIVNKYVQNDTQINFCYPGCLKCKEFQCLDQQLELQQLQCLYIEFYNEFTQKCELIVSQPFLQVTQYLYTPKCKLGFYFKNGKCLQCPSYQGFMCLECKINTNNWKEKGICTFSQIVYLQLISQLFQNQGNFDYHIENDHYSEEREQFFLQIHDSQIFLAQSNDIYLIYYDSITRKRYCQIGYNYQNSKCIQNIYNCLFQQEQSYICKSGYIQLRNNCIKCQIFCKFCQFQNKTLICIIPQENYQISDQLIKKCQEESQCIYPIVKCKIGLFYDILNEKCINKNFTHISQNLIEYIESINVKQDIRLQYILQNQLILNNHSAIQLRYLSAIEQIAMPALYTYKNQNKIFNCEFTIYYRNTPYCMIPTRNYLVNNYNQQKLLYCPVPRYCGYKYIIDCKVQITNKAKIIINDQIYHHFSQIIESITKNIVDIKIVQFNVKFQFSKHNIDLNWDNLFYLDDTYYYQDVITYAISILFENNEYFSKFCDRVYVKFHQIQINGLNISLGEQCIRKHQKEYFQLQLLGSRLILNNTNFINQNRPFQIQFINFTSVFILNTKILNCTFSEEFLFNFDFNYIGNITFRRTVIQYSKLNHVLIQFKGANQIKLVDFIITNTLIYQGIIKAYFSIQNFNILNMIFRYVNCFEAQLIALLDENSSGNVTASDINFYNCDFHTTFIFSFRQKIIIEQLQLTNSKLNQSYIIKSARSESFLISQFILQNFTIINSFLVIVINCKQFKMEGLLMSYKQNSIYALFDIESFKCIILGVRLNNLDKGFYGNLFTFQRQQKVIIEYIVIQGNINSTSCSQDFVSKNNQLIQINSALNVTIKNVEIQQSLFCNLGLIYMESQVVIIQYLELRNLTLDLIQMGQSFIYFIATNARSDIQLEYISINQIQIIQYIDHTFIYYKGANSSIDILNFEIKDVNTTLNSYIFGISQLNFNLQQFYVYNLRNLLILKSENCFITLNLIIIQNVAEYANFQNPFFNISSNYLEIFNMKVLNLQNQLILLKQPSKSYFSMRNIQINIYIPKSDIISLRTNRLKHQQIVQLSNIIIDIQQQYFRKLEFYLFNLLCKAIDISNISVNTLSLGFIKATSSSIKIWNIKINNPSYVNNSIFNFIQSDLKSIIILSNILITSQINSQLQGSCIIISERDSIIIIQNVLIQNFIQPSIVQVFLSDEDDRIYKQRNIFRNLILNNMSLEQNIIKVDGVFKMNMQDLYFIQIQTQELFIGMKASFKLINSLILNSISNVAQLTNNVEIYNSQIVDGQILLQNIKLNQTYILNIIYNINDKYYSQELQLFLSLNEGKSFFKNQQKDYKHHVQFSQDNQYLYLPSGQLLQQFQYLDVKKQIYQQLYESISFVVKYSKYDNTFNCLFQQSINGTLQSQIEIILKFGVNVINDLTFILDPYNNQSIQNILTCNYDQDFTNLTFFVKTFPCQLGEYLFQHQCLVCDIDKNYYSVSYKETNCLIKDNQKIDKIKKGQIQLLNNYWRYQLNSKYIEKCYNNCNGGWKVGDNSCKQGYIGAICQECDIYNIRGQGQYGLDSDKCQICSFDYTLIIKGLLISFWQILLAYMSYSTNTQISNQFLFNKINNRKLSNILDRQNINQVSIMIKLISNYLYALYVIKDNFYLGNYIDWSLNLFNNPNMIISPQLDCMLAELVPINVSYSILIYRFTTPFLVLNMFFLIFIILIFLKQTKYEIKAILIIIYSIYMFNQQIILQILIKQSSYKFYSNIAWVFQNLSILYYSDQHLNMLYKLIIPLSICFWIIPFSIFLHLWKINRSSFKSQKLIGYIYREYNQNCYYWEMIRIYYNFLLMTLLYVFNQKLFLTLILCQIFLLLTQYKTPYSLKSLNKIDQYILIYEQFSFILIFFGDNQNDILIRFTIIIIFNIILLQYLIRQILDKVKFAYQKDIEFIQQKLVNKLPQIQKYLNLEKKEQIKQKIQKLKSSVKLKSFIVQSPTLHSPDVLIKPSIVLEGEIEMQQIEIK